jgi:hypothetical protein
VLKIQNWSAFIGLHLLGKWSFAMARDRGLDNQIDNDEELLNFELDDLSLSDDSIDDPDMDEEIIELVDLVERGSSEDITRDLKAGEWAGAAQRESKEARQAADGMQEADDLDLSDFSFDSDMETEEGGAVLEEGIIDVDLKSLLDDDDITLDFAEEDDLEPSGISNDEISDADLQALLSEADEEELDLESSQATEFLHLKSALEEKIVEEPAVLLDQEVEELGAEAKLAGEEEGASEEDHPESEDTAESEFLPAMDEESTREEGEAFKEEGLPGLSEERLEEMIAGVVREVVERVARETMAEVAERMIGEAIETLKKSLEASEGL